MGSGQHNGEGITYHDALVKRTQVAIAELQDEGRRVSFYSVADHSGVGRSTLYRCDDLRRLVVAARDIDKAAPAQSSKSQSAQIAELQAELEKVTHERDFLLRKLSTTPRYAVVSLSDAA